MKISSRPLFRYLALAGVVTLAACQQTGPTRQDNQTDTPVPPAQEQQPQQQAPSQGPQVAPPDRAETSAPSIRFFLARQQPGEGLSQFQVTPDQNLYFLPQPVFTEVDLQQVVPAQNSQGQVFLRFDFNEQGAQKLATVSSRAVGNYLILSIRDQVVSVPQIAAAYDGGILPVPVRSAEDAQAIVQLLRSGN